jgi:hypothetical protein
MMLAVAVITVYMLLRHSYVFHFQKLLDVVPTASVAAAVHRETKFSDSKVPLLLLLLPGPLLLLLTSALGVASRSSTARCPAATAHPTQPPPQ